MLKTITPINNTTYVERDYANAQEIEKALENSKKVFLSWKQTPLNERKEILTKLVDSFLSNNKEIEEELCRQMGRPISQCGGEMRGFEERARYMIDKSNEALDDYFGHIKRRSFLNFILRNIVILLFNFYIIKQSKLKYTKNVRKLSKNHFWINYIN